MRPEELGVLAGLKAPPNRSAGSEECCGGSCNGWDPGDAVDSSLLGVAFHIENKNRLRALPEGQHDPLHPGHRIALLNDRRQRLLTHTAGLQTARKIRAFPQLWVTKRDCPGQRLPIAVAVAVGLRKAVGGALTGGCPGHACLD